MEDNTVPTDLKQNAEDNDSSNSQENKDSEVAAGTMSKRMKKRLERSKAKEENRPQRRAMERERKKLRKKAKRDAGEELGPSRNKMKQTLMANSSCKVQVAVDCSFDHLMSEKVVNDLVQQLQYCYSSNRRTPNPLQFYVTGIGGKAMERLEKIGQYKQWDVNFSTKNYDEIFKKDDVVYLSSESENILDELDASKVYVIGGLVDHNHHKGLCHKLATEKGLAHAALPIASYLEMKSRKVLTINHVFDILLHYTQSKDWEEAFLRCIPTRKGAEGKLTTANKTSNDNDGSDHATIGNGTEISKSEEGSKTEGKSEEGSKTEEKSEEGSKTEEETEKSTSIDSINMELSNESQGTEQINLHDSARKS